VTTTTSTVMPVQTSSNYTSSTNGSPYFAGSPTASVYGGNYVTTSSVTSPTFTNSYNFNPSSTNYQANISSGTTTSPTTYSDTQYRSYNPQGQTGFTPQAYLPQGTSNGGQ